MKRIPIYLVICIAGLAFQAFEHFANTGSQAMVLGQEKPVKDSGNAQNKDKADNYYLLVFGSQGDPPVARQSHTFACFVKAGSGADDHKILDNVTISWLPKTLNVVVARLLPEEGTNLDLLPTLKWAHGLSTNVTEWGPYCIKKDLYDRAVKQKARLLSGAIRFRAIDLKTILNRDENSNCIHAVSDVAGAEVLDTGTAYGDDASALVVRHLQPWIIKTGETYSWVHDGLDLKKQNIRIQK